MISIQTMLVTSSTLLVISDHFERHGRISVLRSSLWLPAESPEGCGQCFRDILNYICRRRRRQGQGQFMRRRAETWSGDSVNRRSEEFCPSGLQWPSPANVAFSSKRARVRSKRHLAGSEQSAVSFRSSSMVMAISLLREVGPASCVVH